MSLVSYLKALCSRFYSKDESELVGHQAMPSDNIIDLVKNGSYEPSAPFRFVAPSDGVLMVYGTNVKQIIAQDTATQVQTLMSRETNGFLQGFTFLKKGYQGVAFGETGTISVSFIKLVGGG